MADANGRVLAVAGAVASAGLTLYAGRRNASFVLVALFVGWVVAPFVGMVWGAGRWPVWVNVAVAVVAVAVYAGVAVHPPTKMAFWFLVTPLACWVAMGIAWGMGCGKA